LLFCNITTYLLSNSIYLPVKSGDQILCDIRWDYRLIFLLWLITSTMQIDAQELGLERSTDWTIAGLSTAPCYPVESLNISDFNADPTGVIPCDDAFTAAQTARKGLSLIYFPPGIYRFEKTLVLQDSQIIRGRGADSTLFQFDLGGSGDLILASGALTNTITPLSDAGQVGDAFIVVSDSEIWKAGDIARISKFDEDLVNNAWAYHTVAQIIRIESITLDTLFIDQPLRTVFPLDRDPVLRKINPRLNVGIECLAIERIDASAGQTKNIHFRYAADCWVRGVESFRCNFGHLVLDGCSHIEVIGSYFHHAFDYGGGGKGYGVVLQSATNLSLVEDNVLEHLRHSVLLQSGANGNVITLNYSTDPHRSELPNNAAGDLVCHGNYPFFNLFEHNIVQHISIDNSHGANGPYNTFYRNRAELYGIIMSSSNSPSQNFIGNEITNNGSFLGNYILMGEDHFEYGVNHRGTITPPGTGDLTDSSYFYSGTPEMINAVWPRIGPPRDLNEHSIPARDRFLTGTAITVCQKECGDQFDGWFVWSGCGGDDNWFNPANWHPGRIPNENEAVYIPPLPAGGLIFPVINLNTTIGGLWVAKGGRIETSEGIQLSVLKATK
jgi:hypothetical protein